MTITENLQALGSWSIVLAENTPDWIWTQLGYFGHVAIVDGRVDATAVGDGMLTAARYVGVLKEKPKPSGGRQLGGVGMVDWLGDQDGKGQGLEAPGVNLTAATLTAAITAVLPVSVSLGVVYPLADPSARYTGSHVNQSPRAALDIITAAFGVEYRVNGNATVDVGRQDQLYAATPSAIVARASRGSDMALVGLPGAFDTDENVYDYSDRIVLLGQTTDGGTIATGSINAPSNPYTDLRGNPVKRTRFISESGETTGSVAARAQLQLNRFNRIARSLKLATTDFEAQGTARVGDMVWVFDPDTGIVNPSNEVTFRGEVLHPDTIRLTGATWALTEGHSVGFRTGSGTWIDLTPYIVWEDPGTNELTVGDLPQSLSRPTDDLIQVRTDSARAAAADTTIPGVPTGLNLTTSTFQDTHGATVAMIDAAWVQPLNTDGSVMTDLAYYALRYRLTSRGTWQTTYSATTSIEVDAVLDADYEAQVAAVDASGHMGAFSASATVHTSLDTVAPPAPADPVVTSFRGQPKVQYLGVASGGGAMPPDTDHIDVHVGATSTFTPTTATRFDSLTPFAQGISYPPLTPGTAIWVRLVAVDRTGNWSTPSAAVAFTPGPIADGDLSTVNAGRITAGNISADVTISGRFATALTGSRREMNAVGFQAWDASGVQTISLDGVSNLLAGIYKTAISGRRIEIGAGGLLGSIKFFAPSGVFTVLGSITDSGGALAGAEGIYFGAPIAGDDPLWNCVQIATNETYLYGGNKIQFSIGNGLSSSFSVVWSNNKTGSWASTNAFLRFQVFPSGAAFYNNRGESSAVFSADSSTTFYPSNDDGYSTARISMKESLSHNVAWSPSIAFVTQSNVGGNIRLNGASGFEFTSPDETAYIDAAALHFNQMSDARTKADIRTLEEDGTDPVAMLHGMRIVRFRRTRPLQGGKDAEGNDLPEPPALDDRYEIGVLAQEAPPEIRQSSGDRQLIDLGAAIFVVAAALQRVEKRLAAVEPSGVKP